LFWHIGVDEGENVIIFFFRVDDDSIDLRREDIPDDRRTMVRSLWIREGAGEFSLFF